jgi:tetratricopeptide (TPR) repeat protein
LARIELKQLKEAIEDFNKSLELDSKNPGIYSGIGQAYRLIQNYDKALYYLNKALEKSPNNNEFLV